MGEVQQQRIPLIPDQQSGYDTLGGGSPFAKNVVVDRLGTIRRRPGIAGSPFTTDFDAGEPVIGMHCTSTGRPFAVTGSVPGPIRVWELHLNRPATLVSEGTTITATERPVFAETESLLLFVDGRHGIHAVDLRSAAPLLLELGGAHPDPSHIVANSLRLLVNDVVVDQTKVAFSAPASGTVSFAGHEQWGDIESALGTSGFFSAESRPDPIVALAENSNEVWVFGTTNVQTFVPDGTLIYAPVTTREFGCAAPYSVIKDDQAFAWIDDRRRIVHSDGRTVQMLSDPIKGSLDQMQRLDDAYGYRVLAGATDALVWGFPSDGRSLAFQREGGWATWLIAVTAKTGVVGTNEQLVGTSTGKIGALREDIATDFGDPIQAEVTTGRITRETVNRKHCRAVQIHIRRGQEIAGHDNVAELSYRDDEGPWSQPIDVNLGDSPDRDTVVALRSLGVYRSRQWRIRFSGSSDIAIGSVVEEFEILEH